MENETVINVSYLYQVGGSLPLDSPTYVKRQADEDLYQTLKLGEFCYILNSRQMGKSSLRVQTMARLQGDGIACAAIDLTCVGSQGITVEQWYLGIIKSLASSFSLSIAPRKQLARWWRERTHFSPLQRFNEFLEEVLLTEIEQDIVIFIDEIDSILSLDFSVDDFFALIRACYNQRTDKKQYQRLTFALIGVATPADLIADKNRTSFNIGKAIHLTGFQLSEVTPLIKGLATKVEHSRIILETILQWTGGQPFLTQKLCQLVHQQPYKITGSSLDELVHQEILENWEINDEPEHLRTIRDRLLKHEHKSGRLLGLYQQILHQGQIRADNSPEQMELRLSGLVVKNQCKLKIYNRIYAQVFDNRWVNQQLAKRRPYSEAITAWLISDGQDESRLLYGQALQDALLWKQGKSLSHEDEKFLDASQALDKHYVQQALEAEREASKLLAKANLTLTQAQKKAKKTIFKGAIALGILSSVSIAVITGTWIYAQNQLKIAQEAQIAKQLEQDGITARQQFEFREITALLSALEVGQQLKTFLKIYNDNPRNYPVTSPLVALQYILDNIQEQNQFLGHQKGITSVKFSPDGKLLATASKDTIIRIWHLQTGKYQELKGHQEEVYNIAFSRDSQFLASTSADRTTKLWNLQGEVIQQFKGHENEVTGLSFSPDGQFLATASGDKTVKLWNLQGNVIQTFRGHQGWVYDVSFSPDGKILATASQDGTGRLWDLQGREILKLEGHQGSVYDITFSPQGDSLATVSVDKTSRLWNLQGKLIQEFTGQEEGISQVSFSPDGQFLATASEDNTVHLWDLQGQLIAEFVGHQEPVWSLSFSPDGQFLATASKDTTVKLWNLKQQSFSSSSVSEDKILALGFHNQQLLFGTTSSQNTLRIKTGNGKVIGEGIGHQDRIYAVSLSPNEQFIATASRDGTARLWNLQGEQLQVFSGNSSPIQRVSFSPNNKFIATASEDGMVRLWSLEGKLITEFQGHQGEILHISFSPVREASQKGFGQRLATASQDGTAKVWDWDGNLLQTLEQGQSSIYQIVFSENGRSIATVSGDGTAKLWNIDGRLLNTFKGLGPVKLLRFSPDGTKLATASNQGTAKLWDLQGNLIAAFQGTQSPITSLIFSQDGEYLITAFRDGQVNPWRIEELDELLQRGCDWLHNYFTTHPQNKEGVRKRICP